MSAAAATEAMYGGDLEKGPLQQPNREAMLYMHDDVVLLSQTNAAGGGSSSSPHGARAAPPLPPGSYSTTEGGGGASHPVPPPPVAAASDASTAKKKMGQPPGSSARKLQTQRARQRGSFVGLTPHIFTVQAGEDVASRVMSFSCNGWKVCILSANGGVSNVTLRQGYYSCGALTYEGYFDILSLTGSYRLSDSSGLGSRTGGLSVSLAGPDGRVLGGSVAGPLIAASPVQVVIGSFLSDGKKEPDLSFKRRVGYSAFASSSRPPSTAEGP